MHTTNEELLPLIQGMARGETEPLGEFIDAVGPILHGSLLRATGQSVASAVLLERCFEELWRTAPLYDAHYGQPLTWVMSVARIQALDYVSRRRGREARLKSQPDAHSLLMGEASADPTAIAALGGMEAEERELLDSVWAGGFPAGGVGVDVRARFADVLARFADALSQHEAG